MFQKNDREKPLKVNQIQILQPVRHCRSEFLSGISLELFRLSESLFSPLLPKNSFVF